MMSKLMSDWPKRALVGNRAQPFNLGHSLSQHLVLAYQIFLEAHVF